VTNDITTPSTRRRRHKRRSPALFILALVLGFLLLSAESCMGGNTSNPGAACSYIIGDGTSGHNSKVHEVVWPNQNKDYSDSEDTRYVPCNDRNFIVNPPGSVNASGQPIGDRHDPSHGYTTSGTPILVWSTSLFTLNEAETALKKFYDYCYKYTCSTSDSSAGDANFSSDGWNGMLGETFGLAVDSAVLKASNQVTDDIWLKHDPAQYEKLADSVSSDLNAQIRKRTGFDLDVFCGSGSSGWKDPENPGKKGNVYTCSNIRFLVDQVEVDPNLKKQAEQASQNAATTQINKDTLEAAKAKYGPDADKVLATLDILAACKAPTVCVVNVGPGNSSGNPTVAITPPTPTTAAPPTTAAANSGSGG